MGKKEEIERIQSQLFKMALGVNSNTPNYIWRMEAGRRSMKIETKKRAEEYLAFYMFKRRIERDFKWQPLGFGKATRTTF